ncbi:MAG: DUF47 domain-containing protein [Nitrososphaeria archaeon]|nr:DUF47 domain-containing protein [Nitrososphaeria archaeon]NDB51882.1 DUF47 domain-containing protein [Nitrosopumilaceae archaeon]NDB87353.1 DUF47 domain-containing protein [Nitrososphaerota archaeon]NDB45881.1 DUF47 domain-containing protein [Nitrososphaeria archaeon]NDB62742.1 DUF47 domain-containing protein [Nitrosopumilaceae archaeon]
MGQWLSWVKSNEKEILTILDNLAIKAKETAEQLVNLLANMDQAPKYQEEIKSLEKQADELTRSIFAELNKTFITPLDREDIQRIASKTDDIIDYIEGVAGRIKSYHVTSTPPYMLDIAKELLNAIKEVELLISRLKEVKADKSLIEHCRKISEIEHNIDELYRTAVGKLFESNDAVTIIKLKDIYESIESASDRCLDVADVIEDIVLKYT